MVAAKIPKADAASTERFRSLVPDSPLVQVRKLFGHEAAFARGNLFFGTFGRQTFVRLDPREQEEALAVPGASAFEPMAGRPMKGYVVLPEAVWTNATESRSWVRRSLKFALGLPPKKKGRSR